MVRLFHQIGGCINTQTGKPATKEEIAASFMHFMNVNLGDHPDYKTLELCSSGSNLGERLLEALEELENEMQESKQNNQEAPPEPEQSESER